MGGVGVIFGSDERKMILKGGEDRYMILGNFVLGTYFFFDFFRYQLVGGGEKIGRQNEERIFLVVEESRGSQREEVILGLKKLIQKVFFIKIVIGKFQFIYIVSLRLLLGFWVKL